MRVSLTIVEPWDLGEATHWQAIPGELIQLQNYEGGGRVLIRLDKAVDLGDVQWSYLVGSPRHVGDRFDALRAGAKVTGTFTGVTSHQAMSENPFDISNGRGALTFIGDMEPSDVM